VGKLQVRMQEDLALKGLSPQTCKSYIWAVRRFVKWHMRPPEQMGEREVRQYLLHLRQCKASPALVKLVLAGIKFLYKVTLRRPEEVATVPWPKVPRRLPEVLSESEVASLVDAAREPRLRTMLMVGYAAGLRISEVCRLQVADIDSARGVIRVRQGKGSRDRETVLSAQLLAELRRWWVLARPGKTWLFPGRTAAGHIGTQVVHAGLREALERAGITRRVSFHGLRHAFATHLLERGVELCVIQTMLGHKSIRTTGLYAQVRTDLLAKTPDLLAGLPARRQ
jgi:integrase/recombinase XerD